MIIAIKDLKLKFKINISYMLVDGSKTMALRKSNVQRIKRGGLYHYSISAASVLAKVTRDKIMLNLAKKISNLWI